MLIQQNSVRPDSSPVQVVAVYPNLGAVTVMMIAATCQMSPLPVVSYRRPAYFVEIEIFALEPMKYYQS